MGTVFASGAQFSSGGTMGVSAGSAREFRSDSRNGSNNIREEFREANEKIAPFFADKPSTLAVSQISSMSYPGLGAIKKFSIKNHFELMSRILHEKED